MKERMMKRLLYFCLLILVGLSTSAQTLSDSAQISLFTCTPGEYVYSQYGHSAIRVVDPVSKLDITFNYGIFSFNTEDFYLKFIKGETDYQLGIDDTRSFLLNSAYIGRTTYEQVLNLSSTQRQAIFDALVENYRPENRFYRYNFVFDNCATRPYLLLKNALDAELKTQDPRLKSQDSATTYRNLISHYSKANAWVDFGVNLIFGKVADKEITAEERLFLPEELMRYVQHATLSDDTPLTDAAEVALFAISHTPWMLRPALWVSVLCVLLIVLTYFDLRKKRISWWADAVLFFVYGILGSIAFFLTFFSLHPLVGENYNLLFFNPLLFVPCIFILFPKGRTWLLHSGLIISVYFYAALVIRIVCGQAWHGLLFLAIIHYVRIRLVWYREEFIVGRRTKNEGRRMTLRLLVLVFFSIVHSTSFICEAQPRLTVVVCVNGLNEQALADLRPFLPAGGLRTIDEEAHESRLHFPQLVYGGSETLATLATGTTPNTHGIAADTYFDRSTRRVQSVLIDSNTAGIGTEKTLSPAALLSPTFADEFRILHPNENSKIFTVGITPENTLLLAGHAANACAWIESTSLHWATTTYYQKGLPAAADQMNVNERMLALSALPWESTMDVNMYIHPSAKERKAKKYTYDPQKVFTQSPAANKAVIELALAIQQAEQLGKDAHADLLSLELNVISPAATTDFLRSAEQEDMYLGLNQDLGFLLEQLTKRIGKEHFRVVLFGKPALGRGTEAFERANLTINYFNIDRAAALINTYLMALYGHERWIDGGYGQSVYLNRTLIEQKRLSLADLQQQVANFLLEFEGTQEAFPITQVPLLQGNKDKLLLCQTCNKRGFGDVVFTMQPLWLIGTSAEKTQDKIIEPNPTAPLFIYTHERINAPAEQLAATEVKELIVR